MKRYWVYPLLALSLLVNAGVLAGAWFQARRVTAPALNGVRSAASSASPWRSM